MRKSTAIKIAVFFLVVSGNVLLPISQAEPSIKILTAYATSASADSTPVTDLLDVTKEGLWKPQTKDSGTNEGIFFQFMAPVLIDWIEVNTNGGVSQCDLDFYLDGKRNLSNREKREPEFENNQNVFYVVPQFRGDECIFYLGARGKNLSPNSYANLNAKIRSVFIKISSASSIPAITSVRFCREGIGDPLPVVIPDSFTGKAIASSTLAPETAYGCQNLFDDKTDFAWATNGKKTSGVGETVTIELDQPQDLAGLIIWNGYQRSKTHYNANARPSKLLVTINGETEIALTVADKMDAQQLKFPKVYKEVKTFSLKIAGIYTGITYKDMVVSELKLMNKNGNPVIFSLPPVTIKVTDKTLETLLDISLSPYMLGITKTQDEENEEDEDNISGFYEAYGYPHRSIRLRSNGSFVGYFSDGSITEGNWEPLPDGFRIFGKKYVTYYNDSIYMRSDRQKVEVKIFQDTIKYIDPTKTPYSEVKKYLKTILAERDYFQYVSKNPRPVNWWMGIQPHRQARLNGKNEEELLKACYEKAIALKAYLLVSPLFIDLFLPEETLVQAYDFEG